LKKQPTRRSFIGSTAAAAAGMLASSPAKGKSTSKPGPNDTVQLGLIGCGGQGRAVMRNHLALDGVTVVAVCDLNEKRLADGVKDSGNPNVKTYRDYRELLENKDVNRTYEHELRTDLEKYRMAGIDLEVDGPVYIGLELEMEVCIEEEFFQSDIRREFMNLFSNRILGKGKSGIFHPDKLSFGQTLYLSTLYATAQSVEGVISVKVLKFRRLENTAVSGIDSGILNFTRKEIPRLDNDPNFRERGVFNLIIKGGR